jgi:hypothetical protein
LWIDHNSHAHDPTRRPRRDPTIGHYHAPDSNDTRRPDPMTDPLSESLPPAPLRRHLIRAHAWGGALTATLLAGPTSLTELAIIPAGTVFLAGIPWTFRLWRGLWKQAAPACLLALAAWLALALAWSPDRNLGLQEFGNIRFFAVVLLIVPVMRLSATGRRALVHALAFGFLIGHGVQALNAWSLLAGGPDAFRFNRFPDRISGWWDPAVSGTLLTAALGLHLPAALMGRGRVRALALAASCVTIAGLLATGARGGWIASSGLIAIGGTVAVVRAVRTRAALAPTLLPIGVLVLAVLGGAWAFRGSIVSRVEALTADLAAAGAGDYTTADGARIAMKRAAAMVFLDRPFTGAGTGGFAHHARALADRGAAIDAGAIHDHAHDTLLHLAASSGIAGVVLAVGVGVGAGVGGWRWTRRSGLGSYDAGPLFALVGLALATPFDTLHVSGSAAAITGIVVALCVAPPRSGESWGVTLDRRWP